MIILLTIDVQGWFEDGGTDIEKIALQDKIKFDKGVLEFAPGKDVPKEPSPSEETKQ